MALSRFCKKPALSALENDFNIRSIQDLILFSFSPRKRESLEDWKTLNQYIGQAIGLSGKVLDAKLEGHPEDNDWFALARLEFLDLVYFKHAQWMIKKFAPSRLPLWENYKRTRKTHDGSSRLFQVPR